jgi:hypothetical protein
MLLATIAPWACGKPHLKVYFSKQFKKVAGTNRARLHEVLTRITSEAGAHENIEHVMRQWLRCRDIKPGPYNQRPGQIGMATVMAGIAAQKRVGIRITSRADNIMNTAAIRVPHILIECIPGDGGHWSEKGKRAPHPIPTPQMRAVQCPRFAEVKALVQIMGIPQIQIANL